MNLREKGWCRTNLISPRCDFLSNLHTFYYYSHYIEGLRLEIKVKCETLNVFVLRVRDRIAVASQSARWCRLVEQNGSLAFAMVYLINVFIDCFVLFLSGENGKGVNIEKEKLSPDERKKFDDGWQKNAYNQYASDMISLHRSLPDVRDAE